jgi:hypothetical protein
MDFVKEDKVRVQAFLGEGFGREDSIDRAVCETFNSVSVRLERPSKLGLHLNHALRSAEDYSGLFLIRGAGVNLTAARAEGQTKQGNASTDGTLAVLARHSNECLTMPQKAIRAPSKKAPNHLVLPRPKDDRRAG